MFIAYFLLFVLFNGKLTVEIALFGLCFAAVLYAFSCRYLGYSFRKDADMVRGTAAGIRYLFLVRLVLGLVSCFALFLGVCFLPFTGTRTGVCVDICSTLGICAERSAIFAMLTAGEQEIDKVLCVKPDGSSGAPCGACRELMVQLMPESYGDIEIMVNRQTGETVRLGDITPMWWIP